MHEHLCSMVGKHPGVLRPRRKESAGSPGEATWFATRGEKTFLQKGLRFRFLKKRTSLRVENGKTPGRLQLAADEAARSGDLQTWIEYAGRARHTTASDLLSG